MFSGSNTPTPLAEYITMIYCAATAHSTIQRSLARVVVRELERLRERDRGIRDKRRPAVEMCVGEMRGGHRVKGHLEANIQSRITGCSAVPVLCYSYTVSILLPACCSNQLLILALLLTSALIHPYIQGLHAIQANAEPEPVV